MAATGVYAANEIIYNALVANGFNTVTFGDLSQVDLKKQSILPLAHITLSSVEHSHNVMVLDYSGFIIDSVDANNLNPREMLNKFRLADNVEDVLHDLNYKFRIALQTIRKNTSDNITLSPNVSIEALYSEAQNRLAGYQWSFSVTMRGNSIC